MPLKNWGLRLEKCIVYTSNWVHKGVQRCFYHSLLLMNLFCVLPWPGQIIYLWVP